MKKAPELKHIYTEYCSNHPKAAHILQKRKLVPPCLNFKLMCQTLNMQKG